MVDLMLDIAIGKILVVMLAAGLISGIVCVLMFAYLFSIYKEIASGIDCIIGIFSTVRRSKFIANP